jgi:CheY-like chemotaxis protein
MVKRLAEMQGGTVAATSAGAHKGSTFVVRMAAVDIPRQSIAEVTPITVFAERACPRRILVIDDNDDLRQMVEAALALDGHDVRAARDGASGLAIAAQQAPEVVFVDIGLPDIDGYDVARRLRALPGGANVHLIAVTGYGQPEDRRRAAEAGFDAHLTKPVAQDLLLQTMVEVADARSDSQAPAPRAARVAS